MTRASLNIAHLSVGYPRRPVIRDLSLPPIEPGKILALVGPNGAGKTTLVRALAGLLPASGVVQLGSRNLLQLRPPARAACTAFMPQSLPQRIVLSVLEGVLASARATHTGGKAPARDRAAAVLERLGIIDIALEPMDQLSGGQRQLASLAQALVREPQLLLLDEPTSALDLAHQVHVVKLVRGVAASGCIVVAVLHDLNLAARWADAIAVLDKGSLHDIGAPARTITTQMLAAVYGVRATVTQLDGVPHVVVHEKLLN